MCVDEMCVFNIGDFRLSSVKVPVLNMGDLDLSVFCNTWVREATR